MIKNNGRLTSGQHGTEVEPAPLIVWIFAYFVVDFHKHMTDAQNKVVAPDKLQ